jgi:hypothetical protein
MLTDEMKALIRRRRGAPKRTRAFFEAFDPRSVERAQREAAEALELHDLRDSVYRIFHVSFKMYRLRDAAVELAAAMFVPLGTKVRPTKSAIVREMRRWHLDETFIEIFAGVASTDWSEERNAPLHWRADATLLAAGFTIVHEVALASLESMNRLRRRDGFLFHPEEPLDATDALFLEVWTGVGDGLRYMRPEGLEAECVSRLRAKLRRR